MVRHPIATRDHAGSNPVRYFRGRKVWIDGAYPGVYWPEHPMARDHGVVHIHRVVAYEKYYDLSYRSICP